MLILISVLVTVVAAALAVVIWLLFGILRELGELKRPKLPLPPTLHQPHLL